MKMNHEIDLFSSIVESYLDAGESPLSNDELYQTLSNKSASVLFGQKTLVGYKQKPVDLTKRKIRWYQQTLKHAGVLERVKHGSWRLKQGEQEKLIPIDDNCAILGFSTELGVAIIAKCEHFFSRFNEPIHLILTSPPYPLQQPRSYGNVGESDYVDWFCKTIEPVVKHMVPGGSMCINLSNDIFLHKSPARSLYRERLVLALCDRFGLFKCDELIWENASKPPGPIAWASKQRVQLNVAWEPIYWFTNDPSKLRSNNQRVLQPHSAEHIKFVEQGGTKKAANCSDGAYIKYLGSYANKTAGKIARNVLKFGHASPEVQRYKKRCIELGFKPHGAMMPVKLAQFLIEFLTEEFELVVDPLAGGLSTGLGSELSGRRWVCTEQIPDFVFGAAPRFFSL